jgi:hypothetical protein
VHLVAAAGRRHGAVRHRQLVGEHARHLRRHELGVAAQARAHLVAEEDADLVVRLLPDVDGLRAHERVEVDPLPRVEAGLGGDRGELRDRRRR